MSQKKIAMGHISSFLFSIGNHPFMVDQGALGYFIDLENMKSIYYGLNVKRFMKENGVRFSDLPLKLQKQVKKTINDLLSSKSDRSIRTACSKCLEVSDEIDLVLMKK